MRRTTFFTGVLLLFTAVAALASTSHSVLLVGDSLSIGLGKQLERIFADRKGVKFARLGKVSSGLARPDFFDWEKNLEALAKAQKPDTVFIMIGTNDNKSLTDADGSVVFFEDAGWDGLYEAKAARLLDICRKYNPDVRIFWVGAPVMGNKALSGDVKRINAALKSLCDREKNCQWVDTWDCLADDRGGYAMYGKTGAGELAPIRVEDGVHVTAAGARILAGTCLAAVAPRLGVDAAQLMDDAPLLIPADPAEVAMAMARDNPEEQAPGAILRGGVPHVVKPGESLWRIAKRRDMDMERLLAFNPGIDPDNVRPGQTVMLPPEQARLASGAKDSLKRRIADAKAAALSLHNNKYTVRQGDTFWAVAERFGVSPERIAKANPGLKPRSLRPGMSLEIPSVLPAQAGPGPNAAEPVAQAKAPAADEPAAPVKTAEPAESGSATRYIVTLGDNYWSIAQRLGVSPEELEKANPGLRPRRLQLGQVLNIPAAASPAENAASEPPALQTYVVSDGDNLWIIAKRFGVSVKALQKANQDVDPGKLQPGQALFIPRPEPEATDMESGHAVKASREIVGDAGASAPESGTILHRIVRGDTFWGLSRRYGMRLSAIVRANQGLDPRRLRPGRSVAIPLEAFTGPVTPVAPVSPASTGTPVAGSESLQTAETASISPGDALWNMARERGLSIRAILAANPGLDPLNLQVGREIHLPSPEAAVALADNPLKVEEFGGRTIQTYVTAFGDNLWSLSRRFGTSVERLAEENGLTEPARLQAGRTLRIPSRIVTFLDF